MGTALHPNQPTGEIHIPYQWEYADAAARTGATGFTSVDLGKFARQLDNNTIWMLVATTPTWVQIGSGGTEPVFGTEFQQVASLSESANSTVDWVEKLSIDMPAETPAGTYRVGIFYNWRHDDLNYHFEARVQLDDTSDEYIHVQEPKDAGADQRMLGGGFFYVVLTLGAHTIDLDFRTNNAGDTAYIRNARLEVWRVD